MNEKVENKLINLVEESISNSNEKYGIKAYPDSSRNCTDIKIDTKQPEPERLKKRSKKLVFSFPGELIEDGFLQKKHLLEQAKEIIKNKFNEFDWSNPNSLHDVPPEYRYKIVRGGENLELVDGAIPR